MVCSQRHVYDISHTAMGCSSVLLISRTNILCSYVVSDKLHILKTGQARGYQIAENPLLITKLTRIKIAQLTRQNKNNHASSYYYGRHGSKKANHYIQGLTCAKACGQNLLLSWYRPLRTSLSRVKVLGASTQESFIISDFSLTAVINYTSV